MPKIVDHDQRRAEIGRVVEELVHEIGLSEVTIRAVAQRMGCSTSVISYYFPQKLDMLVHAHRTIRRYTEKRLGEAFEEGDDLVAAFEHLLPIDEDHWRDWHTFFAFWGIAPTEHYGNRVWAAAAADAHAGFVRMLTRARDIGQVAAGTDIDRLATEIMVSINGISSLVAQSRSDWPPDRQRAVFRRLLATLLASPPMV